MCILYVSDQDQRQKRGQDGYFHDTSGDCTEFQKDCIIWETPRCFERFLTNTNMQHHQALPKYLTLIFFIITE